MLNDQNGLTIREADKGTLVFGTQDNIEIYVKGAGGQGDSYRQEVRMERTSLDKDGNPVVEKLPPDQGQLAGHSFREKLVKRAKEVFDPPPAGEYAKDKKESPPTTIPNLMDDLGKVSEVLGIPSIRRLMETSEKRTLTERLVALVKENGTLFTTPAGTGFVSVGVDGHVENYALDSEDFDLWLRGFWYESEKRRVEEEAEAAYESLLASLGPMAEEERLRSLLKIYEPSLIKE